MPLPDGDPNHNDPVVQSRERDNPIPFIRLTVPSDADESLRKEVANYNALSEGAWMLCSWVQQCSQRTPQQILENLKLFTLEHDCLYDLFNKVDTVRHDWGQDAATNSVEALEESKRKLGEQIPVLIKPQQVQELSVTSIFEVDKRRYALSGFMHEFDGVFGLISADLQDIRDTQNGKRDDDIYELAIDLTRTAQSEFQQLLALLEYQSAEKYPKMKIPLQHFLYYIDHHSTFYTLLKSSGITVKDRVTVGNISNKDKGNAPFAHYSDVLYINLLENIARNAVFAYMERDVSFPDKKGEEKTLEFDMARLSHESFLSNLSDFEQARLEGTVLQDCPEVFVAYFRDTAVGVDLEIERNGFTLGRSIRSVTSGRGEALDFHDKILREEYGGALFLHNRKDLLPDEHGAEMMLCLPIQYSSPVDPA